MKKNLKRIILLAIIVGVIIALRFTDVGRTLTLENLQKHSEQLKQFSGKNYVLSVIVFICIYVTVTALSIPGAAVLTMGAGFLYSTIPAAIYVNIGATAGATLAFLFVRYIGGQWVQEKYGEKLAGFNEELNRNGANYLLTLRFIPAFPFFLINILAGLTKVSARTFIWTTAVGIIPGSLVYAYAGQEIGQIKRVEDILTGRVLLAFILLAAFAVIPVIIQRLRKSRNRGISNAN